MAETVAVGPARPAQERQPAEPVPPGHKFVCLGFSHLNHVLSPGSVTLPGGVRVSDQPPFNLDARWREWLGSLRFDGFATGDFFILAARPSDRPNVLDAERDDIRRAASRVLFGVLLQGVPRQEGAVIVSGGNEGGQVQLFDFATMQKYHGAALTHGLVVDRRVIERAGVLAQQLEAIATAGAFQRLQRGLGAWELGMRQNHGALRLHLFVRATEALLRPVIGSTKRQFVHRAKTIVGASAAAQKWLSELYDLRSATEHLNDWGEAILHVPPAARERHGLLRAFQAEVLAGHAYIRILEDPAFRENWRTDATVDGFWKRPDDERTATMGVSGERRPAVDRLV